MSLRIVWPLALPPNACAASRKGVFEETRGRNGHTERGRSHRRGCPLLIPARFHSAMRRGLSGAFRRIAHQCASVSARIPDAQCLSRHRKFPARGLDVHISLMVYGSLAGHGQASAARSLLHSPRHSDPHDRTYHNLRFRPDSPQRPAFLFALSPLVLGPLPSRCHLPGDRAIQEMEPDDPKFSRFASRLRYRTGE